MAAFGRFRSWPITAARLLEPHLRAMGLRVPASIIDGTSSSVMVLKRCLEHFLTP